MRARTWTLVTVASAVALAAWAGGAPAQAPAGALAQARPAAVVNGEPIAMAELEAILARDGPSPVQLPENQMRQKRLGTLQGLIDNLLLIQFLRQSGPRVDPAEVAKELGGLVEAQKKNGKTLQDFLREQGETEAELRGDMASLLQWRDYVKARVTEDDLKRYYDENKDFFDRTTVRVSHIVFRLLPTATEAERQQTRDKLLAVRQEIVCGKVDFAEAAKKYSQCPSAPSGGDLGFILRKMMVDDAFARAAFALQPGQVSDVVQSDYGLHLIKLTERKPGQPSEFAKVKEAVQELYIWDLRQSIVNQMRRTAKIEVNVQ
jgi:peptidyl-prolyl cis-trans isomerase C